jgi:hypothetical protein
VIESYNLLPQKAEATGLETRSNGNQPKVREGVPRV